MTARSLVGLICLLFFGVTASADKFEINDWMVIGPVPYTTASDREEAERGGAEFIRQAIPSVAGVGVSTFSDPVSGRLFFHERWGNEPDGDQVAFAAIELDITPEQAGFYEFTAAYDTDIAVFVNGVNIYSAVRYGSGVFFGELTAGVNRVAIKNIRYSTGKWWAIRFHIADGPSSAKEAVARAEARHKKALYVDFGNNNLACDDSMLIATGELPRLTWRDPKNAEQVLGDTAVTVTWFDNELNPITSIDHERAIYWAFAEAELPDNGVLRRYYPFYTAPGNWCFHPNMKALFVNSYFNENGVNSGWEVAVALGDAPERMPTFPARALELRAKYYPTGQVSLAPPKRLEQPAKTLRHGSEAEAGVNPGTAAALDAVWRRCFEENGMPFHTQAARNGVIFYSKGYGEIDSVPTNEDHIGWLASISKSVTGLLFARFVDQGLIDPDESVARYLPAFAACADKVMTPRMCLTHTNGLSGHFGFGGLGNVFADDIQAWLLPMLRPGAIHEYNGEGYNLMGLYMMSATGKPIHELYEDSYYKPLEIKGTSGNDQGGGYYASSATLAKFAQLMLNKGAYGNYEFFSPTTYETIMPVNVGDYIPQLSGKLYWGLGISPMGGYDFGLDYPFYGHGAASMAIFLFNPVDQTFIVQQRDKAYGDASFSRNMAEVLQILYESVER